MRMVKSDAEIQLARHAVAIAMMHGDREAIAEGVPEYEVGMATMTAGSRKAAMLLETH
jgi:Xaa-Pro aminopeptidase